MHCSCYPVPKPVIPIPPQVKAVIWDLTPMMIEQQPDSEKLYANLGGCGLSTILRTILSKIGDTRFMDPTIPNPMANCILPAFG